MRVDGIALTRAQTEAVNAIIDRCWQDGEDVDNEGFIQGSFGPDCIELLNAGEDWVIHDRDEPGVIFFKEDRTTHVASRELFQALAKLSPNDRVKSKPVVDLPGYDSPSWAVSHRPFSNTPGLY